MKTRRQRGDQMRMKLFIILRTTIWPLINTGVSTILLGPIMPTSGRLITGVVTTPPRGPREVRVMVPPDKITCGNLYLLWLPYQGAAISVAVCQISRLSAWRTTGTINPLGVCAAMPICTPLCSVTMPASSSNVALHCGQRAEALTIARMKNGIRVSLG